MTNEHTLGRHERSEQSYADRMLRRKIWKGRLRNDATVLTEV